MYMYMCMYNNIYNITPYVKRSNPETLKTQEYHQNPRILEIDTDTNTHHTPNLRYPHK